MFQKLKELLGLDPIKNQSDAYTRRVADINKLGHTKNIEKQLLFTIRIVNI